MKIKWLGHASFFIRTKDKKIYIDPYIGDYSEKADIVLITHEHRDHCDPQKLSLIREPSTIILTSSTCAESIPDGNVEIMSPGDVKELNGLKIYAVEAYNFKRFRSQGVPYHPVGTQVGFVLEAEEKRIYHTGDSDLIPSMKKLENITLALLPTMGRAVMDLDEAVDAAITINPEIAMPMHRRETDPMKFKNKVESRSNVRVIVMSEGEEITL
jgi:L-ascorbate metabolism protein UlaG (beta-lactamase superfamily)